SASYSQIEKVTNSKIQSIIIFPNPVREVLNIQLYAEQQENALIQIYDLKGSLITKRKINITKGTNLLKQEVFNLADGSYYVVIQGSRVWKAYFVKE
ncbi:MAG: T9SS type A sorting domain-containing protein, partial [Sphingobacteriales bacterium]|nr:T9SS type A sorting domain-containing protein [Sphingobacteriales bacterium]